MGEDTLQKEIYYFIVSKRIWVTSDILQAAVWPNRDSKAPARGKLFYKWTCIFVEAFTDRATKLQYFAWPCAELQHHSCELQALFRTTASRTRNWHIHLQDLFEKSLLLPHDGTAENGSVEPEVCSKQGEKYIAALCPDIVGWSQTSQAWVVQPLH